MILDFGHFFIEMVLDVPHIPKIGERLQATDTLITPGGKAINQGIAAARAGAKVSMIGTIGDDLFGKDILSRLQREGITATGLVKTDGATGIMATTRGKNSKTSHVSHAGPNFLTSSHQIPTNAFNYKTLVMVQDEIAEQENVDVLERARAGSAITFMDADMKTLSAGILKHLDYLVLRHAPHPFETCKSVSKSVKLNCIIPPTPQNPAFITTQDGSLWSCDFPPASNFDENFSHDIFSGTLAACIQAAMPLPNALKMATAGAYATTQITSKIDRFPYLDDIEKVAATLAEPKAA